MTWFLRQPRVVATVVLLGGVLSGAVVGGVYGRVSWRSVTPGIAAAGPAEREEAAGPPVTDCTNSLTYWRTHNRFGHVEERTRHWPVHEHTLLCGSAWYDLLWTARFRDPWYVLARAWITATLNAANGASTPYRVEEALRAAQELLKTCMLPEASREDAWGLAALLSSYNSGGLGPPLCRPRRDRSERVADEDDGGQDDDDADRAPREFSRYQKGWTNRRRGTRHERFERAKRSVRDDRDRMSLAEQDELDDDLDAEDGDDEPEGADADGAGDNADGDGDGDGDGDEPDAGEPTPQPREAADEGEAADSGVKDATSESADSPDSADSPAEPAAAPEPPEDE